MKTTFKNIRAFASSNVVVDVTGKTLDELEALQRAEGFFTEKMYAEGLYGSGMVLEGGKTKALYSVTKPSKGSREFVCMLILKKHLTSEYLGITHE